MKKITFLLLIVPNLLVVEAFSQPFVVKLWPDGIPGSRKDTSYVEKITKTDGRVTRCERVTDPDLTVYLPPADRATG